MPTVSQTLLTGLSEILIPHRLVLLGQHLKQLMIVAAVVGILAAWAGVGVTVLVFLWNQQNKRIDVLRQDVKELRAEHRADNKAINEKVDYLRDEVKGLPLKIMEMLRKAPH